MVRKSNCKRGFAVFLAIIMTAFLVIPNVNQVKAKEETNNEAAEVTVEVLKTASAIKAQYSDENPMILESVDYSGNAAFNRNNFRALYFMLRAGIECGDLYNDFMNSAIGQIENKEMKAAYNNLETYSALILLCKANGDSPKLKFIKQGMNLNEKLIACYDSYDATAWETFNPYYYNQVASALNAAMKEETIESIKADIKNRRQELLTKLWGSCKNSEETGYGFDYWGLSPDNDGTVLPALKYYDEEAKIGTAGTEVTVSQENVNEFIEKTIAYEKATYLKDGCVADGGYGANKNSTGLMLENLANFATADTDTAKVFHALLTYKEKDASELYASEYSKFMATIDAMEGLLSYEYALAFSNGNVYNVEVVSQAQIAQNNGTVINGLVEELPDATEAGKEDLPKIEEIEELYSMMSRAGQLMASEYKKCEEIRKVIEAIHSVLGATTGLPAATTNAPATTAATNTTEQAVTKFTIKLKKKSGKVKVGKKLKIKATASNKGKITYKSMNKKIAKVSKKGVIKGVKAGKTKIKVTCAGVKKYFKVTVVKK